MSRRFRRLYRPRPADTIQFGYRDPETNDLLPPNPKQSAAHASAAEHLFFGGAVGSGKTVWLCVVGIMTCLIHAGVHVAIFRRHFTELTQNVIPQIMALLPVGYAKYNSQTRCFRFPNGSILWLGHCARDSAVYQYQGNQWVKLLIDEASHMTQFMVGYLTTRVRSPRRDVLLQLLMTSNPGGPGHGFLKRGWVQPSGYAISHLTSQPQPLDIWRPRAPKERPTRYMPTRQFIPAYFADNYILQLRDPTYLDRTIGALVGPGGGKDSAKGKQLAEGDWDINDGMMFAEDWQAHKIVTKDDTALLSLGLIEHQVIPWHVKPSTAVSGWRPHPSATIYGSVDYGYGAPFSFHLHAVMPGNHVRTFREIYRAGLRDEQQAKAIRRMLERLMAKPDDGGLGIQKPSWIVYDPQMDGSRAEVNISETIADVYHRELADPLGIKIVPGGQEQGARLRRIQVVKGALAPMSDGFPHWDVTEDCPELIRTLPDLPVDEDDPEYIDEDAEDHAYEDCGRFFQMRPAPPRLRLPSDLDELDPLSRAEQVHQAKKHGELPATIPHLDVRRLADR